MPEDTGWIQTFTGRQFWPLNPRPEDVCIEDIAHALSMVCRYQGHVRQFYSVAEHCVFVSHFVPPEHALWGLLHDAAEAYMADVARPIKRLLPGIVEAEARILATIAERFGLPLPLPDCVHLADLTLLATERRDLMAAAPVPWISIERVEPLPFRILPHPAAAAEVHFLARFRALTGALAALRAETTLEVSDAEEGKTAG